MSNIGVGTYVDDQYEQTSSPFDLFSTPNIVTDLLHGKTLTIFPHGPITNTGPYDFIIPADPSDYTLMPFTRLEGELEIVKPTGGVIVDADLNAYVNLLTQSIFRQVECDVGGTQVCDLSTPTYAYKAFLETHLGFTNEQKKIMFENLEWYSKDTIGKENTFSITAADAATSFVEKHTKLKAGGKFPFSQLVHVDFLNCHKPLIPNIELKLRFIRNEDSFSLLGAERQAMIKVNNLSLSVRRISIDPQVSDSIHRKLESTPVLYPITSSKIKTYTISSGRSTERVSQIFRGKLPKQVIIGFVDSRGVDGSITKNPFKFEHFDLNYFQAYVNGEPIKPHAFKPDFTNSSYMKEYRWFLDNMGCYDSKNPLDITYKEFGTNSTFFAFDLSPEMCNLYHHHGNENGVFDFDVGFKTALANNITAIVYGSFHEVVMIDKNRNITLVD
jgi:hypothetical protein